MSCNVCGYASQRFLFEKNGYRIVRCGGCGLVFVADPPGLPELEKHYDWNFFKGGADRFGYLDYEAEKKNTVRNFADRIALIEKHRPGGRLLEVGCALGFFLAQLGPQWEKVGVELSRDAAAYAREKLGLDVREGELESLDFPEASFDVVTMWDVIEHVRDPMKLLRAARRLLKPGGAVVITTGDVSSLSSRLSGKSWYLMIPPTHLYFFSRKTLGEAFARADFTVGEAHYYGKRVPFEEIFFRLSYMAGIPWLKGLAERAARSPLGGHDVYYNLFDIMTVLARPV